MKKSIELIISGRRVCSVGYRPFLLLNAMRMGVRNFYAYNSSEGGEERVVAQLYGDEDKINRCIDFIRANHPELAEVGKIEVAGYEGEIMAAGEFLQILQFEQINKGIPAILSINKKQDTLIEKQDIMIQKQDIMIQKQDSMLEKQDIMIEKQESMVEKQNTTVGILKGVKEDTSAIKNDISALRKDTSETLYEKYEQLSREIVEIKTTLSEIKAKVA